MKSILTLFLIAFSYLLSAQSVTLKKRFLRSYVGIIPSYEMNLNNQIISVKSSEIEVRLTRDSIFIDIDNAKWEGTYITSKLEKKKYELTGKMHNTGIPERLLLDTKLKKLTRKGLFPQPDGILERKKKGELN